MQELDNYYFKYENQWEFMDVRMGERRFVILLRKKFSI